jgi:arylformamidase
MELHDITRQLAPDLAPWPGDVNFDYRLVARLSEGSSVNLGRITTSVHSGTHADAYFHFDDSGLTIDRMEPGCFLGRALVLDVTERKSLGKISLGELEPVADQLSLAPRLLLKTGAWPDSTRFPESIPTIADGVAQWLGKNGVRLLGLDLPSVDAIDSKDLKNHHALASARVAILEGLDLSAVAAGIYWLAALPLKVMGGDGAPVRAVLWRE